MELQVFKDRLLDYFANDFDHDLVSDSSNNPFVRISLISISPINPHCDSFGFYATKRGVPAVHSDFTTGVMAASLALEAKYIMLKPSKAKPIEDILGYVRGITVHKNQILVVTVITNPEDAGFVCQSVIKELQIIIER